MSDRERRAAAAPSPRRRIVLVETIQGPPRPGQAPRAAECQARGRPEREREIDVYLDAGCYEELTRSAARSGAHGNEVGGFLLGCLVEPRAGVAEGIWIRDFVE